MKSVADKLIAIDEEAVARRKYDSVIAFAHKHEWLSIYCHLESADDYPVEHFLTPSGALIRVEMCADDVAVINVSY